MKLSFNFDQSPLKVRLPKRRCLSKNAINKATQGTMATKPTMPVTVDCHELKFNTEIAANKSGKVHVEKSPTRMAFNTLIISSSAREMDKNSAGNNANSTM